MVYHENNDGTVTYYLKITNMGPPQFTNYSTPPGHTLKGFNGNTLNAGGKSLSEDKYFVGFGIDTLSDNLVIKAVGNASTAFKGRETKGFHDADHDGKMNQVISWELPNNFSLDQTIKPGQTAGVFEFIHPDL